MTTPTLEQIKAQAKALHQELKKSDPNTKLGHVYEVLSHQYGFKDWNVFSASLKADEQRVNA